MKFLGSWPAGPNGAGKDLGVGSEGAFEVRQPRWGSGTRGRLLEEEGLKEPLQEKRRKGAECKAAGRSGCASIERE